MRLCELLAPFPNQTITRPGGGEDPEICGIAYDSRKIKPGFLFVAIKGTRTDGHRYLGQATEQGAVALVVDANADGLDRETSNPTIPVVVVQNSRAALAPLAAAFFGYPARYLTTIGITGTKGKTTTTTLISHLLEQHGARTGMITTVDLKIGAQQEENIWGQSTPEALEIQSLLRAMVDAGCDYAVLEASSHGLSAQWNRLGNCAFSVAVYTNVTHEHLDYHGTLEQYRRDKTRLFTLLGEPIESAYWSIDTDDHRPASPRPTWAIVNADDPHHQRFLDAAPVSSQRLCYALDSPPDPRIAIRGIIEEWLPNATRLHIHSPWGKARLILPLPGKFNASNALAAVSVALSQNVSFDCAIAALECAPAVRGRMQWIDEGQPFGVMVDYAHNPDSFTQVMEMIRPQVSGKLIAVFGSAGERDREKRPQQGAIAAHFCDLLILTDEDPRGEDPEAILADIARGAEQAGKKAGDGYLLIPDRATAIRTAIDRALPGDFVLLLGKGHERSIRYARGHHPWDEAGEARLALRERGYHRSGPFDLCASE